MQLAASTSTPFADSWARVADAVADVLGLLGADFILRKVAMELSHDTFETGVVMAVVQNVERMAQASQPRLYRVAYAHKTKPVLGHSLRVLTLEKAREVACRANLLDENYHHWVEGITE